MGQQQKKDLGKWREYPRMESSIEVEFQTLLINLADYLTDQWNRHIEDRFKSVKIKDL